MFHVNNIIFLLLYALKHAHLKNLVSISYYIVDLLYIFSFPTTRLPLVTTILCSVSMCLFLFGLVLNYCILTPGDMESHLTSSALRTFINEIKCLN